MNKIDLTKIGGSDVATIIGQNPFSTPLELYSRLTTVGAASNPPSRQQTRGNLFEDAIAADFRIEMAEEHGILLPPRNIAAWSDERFRANADDWFPDFGFGAEYKTASLYSFRQYGYGDEEIPPAYLCQCLWYIEHFNATHWYCYVMHSVDKWKAYKITRDNTVQGALVAAAYRFWEDHVVKRIPPAGSDTTVVLPDYSKAVKELNQLEAEDFIEYNQARKEEAHWACHRKEKADALRARFSDYGAVSYGGAKLSWVKVTRETTSWKNVAMELQPSPSLVSKYTVKTAPVIQYRFQGAKNDGE